MLEHLPTVQKQVEFCLEHFEETRNSDKTLAKVVWQHYHGVGDAMLVDDIFRLPHVPTIKRIRAKLQNVDKKWLPTDPEVQVRRHQLEKDWKNHLGYPTDEIG